MAGWRDRRADRRQRSHAAQPDGAAREGGARACPRLAAAGNQGLRRACAADEVSGARGTLGDARGAQLLLEPGGLPAREAARQGLVLLDLPSRADRRLLAGKRHERRAGDRRLRGDAEGDGAAAALSRRPTARRPGRRCRFAGAMHGLGRRDRRRAQRDLQRRQWRCLLLAEHLAGDCGRGRHGAGRGRAVQPGGGDRAARGGLGAYPGKAQSRLARSQDRSSASRFNTPTTRWGSDAPRRRRRRSPRRSS